MKNKEFDVCLEITTPTATLGDITDKVGLKWSGGSHNKGDQRLGRPPFSLTIWRLNSELNQSATLEEHFGNIVERFPPEKITVLKSIPAVSVRINIGIFSQAVNCTVVLSNKCLDLVRQYKGIEISISYYPSKIS